MAYSMNELKKQIIEKNIILNSISLDDNSAREKAQRVKSELDKLLYLYIKSLKFNNDRFSPCW